MVSMSTVWDRTGEFLSDNVGAVATVAALALFLPGVAGEILTPLAKSVGAGGKLGLGLVSLILSLVSLFGQTALVALALEPTLGSGGAFARGATRFPAMLGVSIVLLIGLFMLCLPPVIALAIGGVDMTALAGGGRPDISPGVALFFAAYALILLPVLAWLLARLAVVAAAVVAERRGVGAIGRSFALTRGLALRIIGAFLLFLVVGVVATLAAKLVFGTIFRLTLGGEGPVAPSSVLTALFVGLVSTAMTIVLTAFAAKLYVAVRDRAEMVSAVA